MSARVPRQAQNHKIWWVRVVEGPPYCGVEGKGGGRNVEGLWTGFGVGAAFGERSVSVGWSCLELDCSRRLARAWCGGPRPAGTG